MKMKKKNTLVSLTLSVLSSGKNIGIARQPNEKEKRNKYKAFLYRFIYSKYVYNTVSKMDMIFFFVKIEILSSVDMKKDISLKKNR